MSNPDLYVLVNGSQVTADSITNVFSNLEWGKDEACKNCELLQQPQVIYKLVPVMKVKVKVTVEVVTESLSEQEGTE